MNSVRSCLLGLVLTLAACSGGGMLSDEYPSEFEFFEAVIACTEERTGLDFGAMSEGEDGAMTVRAFDVVASAERQAGEEYRACVEQSIPVVDSLDPITGYGDLSGTTWSEVDWEEFARLQAECARNEGFEVRIAPDDFVEPAGPFHLRQVTVAVLEACGDGLNLPPLS